MKRGLTRGFLSIFNAKLLMSVIGILSLPLIVRFLGPKGYGDYAFLTSSFSLLMIFVSSGVTDGVQKFVAEQRTDGWQTEVVGFYLKLAVSLAVLGSLALVAVTWAEPFQRSFGSTYNTYFYLLAGLVVVRQLQSFTRRTLLGFGLEPYSEALSVVQKALWVGIGLGLATLGFGVAGFLGAQIIAAVVVFIAGFAVLSRRISIRSALSTPMRTLPYQELLSFNGQNVLLVLLMMSLYHVDIMMVRVLVDSESTGYYKAALALAEYIWLIPQSFQLLLLHSTSDMWAQDSHDRISDLASAVTRYVFLFTALLAIGVYSLADTFVPLYYGPAFRVALEPLVLLLPGALGFALSRPLYGINKATGRLRPLTVATIFAALGNVVLNALLIPRYGIGGAAMATSASYGSMFILQVACGYHYGYDPLADTRPVRLLATVVVSGPLIFSFESFIEGDLLTLSIVPVVGFIVFWTVALGTGAVTARELSHGVSSVPLLGQMSRSDR